MLPQASNRSSTALHKLDYAFDWFGNIKSQQMASESGGPTPPAGLNFTLAYDSAANESSSSYFGKDNTNRITTAGFAFDGNGNSLRFRGQYQQAVGALWTPQNRMRAFIEGDPTAGASYPNESYQYDTAGYRLVKTDKTGKPLLSIRDEKGATLSEFIVDQGASSPRLDKDFVYANGQLLVERTVSPAEPTMQTHSVLKSGNAYNFKLTSQTGFASYAVDISANSGWRRQVGDLHPDGQNVIALDESNFSPGETNFVRVRIESPEASGYSAPVSLTYDASVTGSSANQIRSFTVSRDGTNIIVRWALGQASGKQTKLYFKRADGTATYLLTPAALSSALTSFTLDSQALASPCGNFWGTQFNAGVETAAGPSTDLGASRAGEQGTQDGCGGSPPPGPVPTLHFVQFYRHADHLGSLRVSGVDGGAGGADLTDSSDYYPFGQEFSGSHVGSRKRYAGQERDGATGADYMLARYHSLSSSRFLSTDPTTQVKRATRTSAQWNRYSYVLGRPLTFTDPSGEDISISITFKGGGWTDAAKKVVLNKVQAYFSSLGVGKAYAFDSAKQKHGSLWSKVPGVKGYQDINVRPEKSPAKHDKDNVWAGDFAALPDDKRTTAIANAICHEVIVHKLGAAGPGRAYWDTLIFDRGSIYRSEDRVKEQYGTIADSMMQVETPRAFVNGPLPIQQQDKSELLDAVGPTYHVEPPEDD